MSESNITRIKLDPENPSHGKTDWEKVRAMTDEEIEVAAATDSDCLPLSQEELKEFRPVPDVVKR
jgi:hypothetical protein